MEFNGGRKLFTIPGKPGRALLPKEFETTPNWTRVTGDGSFSKSSELKLEGNASLRIDGIQQESILISPATEKFQVNKLSLIVLVWTGHRLEGNNLDGGLFYPTVCIQSPEAFEGMRVLNMGIANQGMHLNLKDDNPGSGLDWMVGTTLGLVPKGNYSFKIILKATPNRPVLFDGLRLFIFELGTENNP